MSTQALVGFLLSFRSMLTSFLASLDVPYSEYFDCPCCAQLPHEQRVFITDCKEMGVKKLYARDYAPPVVEDLVVDEAL